MIKSIKLLSSKLYNYKHLTLGLIALIVLTTVIYSLNKGLIFSDEAWYLLHLRFPEAAIPTSQWHAYAIKFFPKNILHLRIIIVSLIVTSGIIFSYGYSRFVSKPYVWFILPVTIIGLFVLYTPVQFVPNYITFNTIIIFTGSGLFLLALGADNKQFVVTYSLLAGIVFAQLLFIMITNMAIYSFLLIIPFLLQQRKKAILNTLFLILGSILGLTIFFVTIKSFNEYYNETLLAIKYHSFDNTHGIKDLIKWCINTLYYIIKELSLPALLLLFIKRTTKNRLNIKLLAIITIAIYFITIIIFDLRTNFRNITPPTILLSIAVFIIIDLFLNKQYKQAILGIFLFFIPLFGCLGTDVSFSIRSSLYMMPVLIFVTHNAITNNRKTLYLLILLFLLYATFQFSMRFINSAGWNGYVITQQTESLENLNINKSIKINPIRYRTIEEINSVIKPGDATIVSNRGLWGYVYFSGAKPLLFNFAFNEQLFNFHLRENRVLENLNKLVLIEDSRHPFSQEFIENLKFDKNQRINLNNDKNITIYILEN